jgi:hypothetical protein
MCIVYCHIITRSFFYVVSRFNTRTVWMDFNPLNAELNPICHLLALLGGATIVVVSRLRVNHIICALLLLYMYGIYEILGYL